MRTKNHVDIIGFVGNDPELQHTTGGTVARFSVATTERWKDKDGQVQERTEWHRIAFWGPRAETLVTQIGKGSLLEVEGALRSSTWEKDGTKRTSWEIVGTEYRLLGRPAPDQETDEGDASHAGSGEQSLPT
jgi:single-strand DNA-binding protein